MKKLQSIDNIIEHVGKHIRVPASRLVDENPTAAAMLSKLTKPRTKESVGVNTGGHNIKKGNLDSLSKTISDKTTDAENMMLMFPDLKLAAQILVSLIISPTDMMSTEILYTTKKPLFNSELTTALLATLKTEMNEQYNFTNDLYDMIYSILFKEGSDIRTIIPEAGVDELINEQLIVNYAKISHESLTDEILTKTISNYSKSYHPIHDSIFTDNKGKKAIRSLGLLGSPDKDGMDVVEGFTMEKFGDVSKTWRDHQNANIDNQIKFTPIDEKIEDYVTPSNYTEGQRKQFEANKEWYSRVLESAKKVSEYDKYITVTDNYNVLRIPSLAEHIRKSTVKDIIKTNTSKKHKFTMESYSTSSQPLLESKVYKEGSNLFRSFVKIKNPLDLFRESVGRPLVSKQPPESCMIIHEPGDETKHVGYIFLIDDEGYSINKHSVNKHQSGLASVFSSSQNSMSSFLIQRSKDNLVGHKLPGEITLEQGAQIFSEIIEDDFLVRLRNGTYGKKLAMSKSADLSRIMLARTYANQYTKMVFVPEELVSYIAFDYNKNGTGKTILEDLLVINSIRAVTMFSRVTAALKNSIGTTTVNIVIDEDDIDPDKTINEAMYEVMRTRQQQSFPIGISSPAKASDYVQRAGVEFTITGHPAIPDTKFEFANKSSTVTIPDEGLTELLRKTMWQGMGIPPEMVDGADGPEFATTAVQNNILIAKRTLLHQEKLEPKLTDRAVKLAKHDVIIHDKLNGIVKTHLDVIKKSISPEIIESLLENGGNDEDVIEYVLEEFFDNLQLSLPKPDMTTLANQTADLTIFVESIDKMFDAYVSEDIFSGDISGENLASKIGPIKASMRAGLIRNFCAKNNILPELTDIFRKDEDGNPVLDLFTMIRDYDTMVQTSMTKFIRNTKVGADATNADIDKIENPPTDTPESTETPPSNEDVTESENAEDGAGGDMFNPK